jgi:RNA polymerase sigma-70 factor (ECF subfamily)
VTDKSERELVESALDGSIDSFGNLCGRYYNSMVAIAYSVLGDHHLAQDAAQETFARALENLDKLRQKKRFGFWLGGICRNVACDMAKERSRQVSVEELPTKVENDESSATEAVQEAVDSLSACDKELVVLRYYNRLSHEQMGAVLGLSKAAINNRLVRAKRKMAKYLRRNGFGEMGL